MKELDFIKVCYRSNARRKKLFGVEEATFKHSPGRSNRSYYTNLNSIKEMARENLKVLKLMNTEEYKNYLNDMRKEAVMYYSKIRK